MDVAGSRAAVAHGREAGRRAAGVPRRRAVLRGWGFPNFSATYTIMNNDLQAVIDGNKTTAQMLADVAASLKG